MWEALDLLRVDARRPRRAQPGRPGARRAAAARAHAADRLPALQREAAACSTTCAITRSARCSSRPGRDGQLRRPGVFRRLRRRQFRRRRRALRLPASDARHAGAQQLRSVVHRRAHARALSGALDAAARTAASASRQRDAARAARPSWRRSARRQSGIDRALFTPAERAARERFVAWARADGLHVEQDRAGNVFARLDAAPDAAGAAARAVRIAPRHGAQRRRVRRRVRRRSAGSKRCARIAASGDAAAARRSKSSRGPVKKGSRFPLGCLGSSVYAGLTPYDEVAALAADDGETFAAALRGPARPARRRPGARRLPAAGGVRRAAHRARPGDGAPRARGSGSSARSPGQCALRVVVDGVAGHAGTVPMGGCVRCAVRGRRAGAGGRSAPRSTGRDTVATVGHLAVEPNQTTSCPAGSCFRIDLRSVDDGRIASARERRIGRGGCARSRAQRGVRHRDLADRRHAPPCRWSRGCASSCAPRARRSTRARSTIASGAGHDAMCVAHVAPTAMIFVPSIGGRSHVGDERTAPADLELGVEALAATLLAAAAAASVQLSPPPKQRISKRMQFFICGSALRGQPDHGNLGAATVRARSEDETDLPAALGRATSIPGSTRSPKAASRSPARSTSSATSSTRT